MKKIGLLVLMLWQVVAFGQNLELVKDINPGNEDGMAGGFTRLANQVYFNATNGSEGVELWTSYGTSATTYMVKDINAGSEDSRPFDVVALGDKLLFWADDGENGDELWVSNGIESGTFMLKDINEGTASSRRRDKEQGLLVIEGVLYFSADYGNQYGSLWRTDGTEEGTYLVKNVCPDCSSNGGRTRYFVEYNGQLFLRTGKGDFYMSDGTSSGTVKTIDNFDDNIPNLVDNIYSVGGFIFIAGEDSESGLDEEPWISDGTLAGTYMLKDIDTLGWSDGSNPGDFIAYEEYVYFRAEGKLWRTDGTEEGTTNFIDSLRISDHFDGAIVERPSNLMVFNDYLFFTALRINGGNNDYYLWRTDGTPEGTIPLFFITDWIPININLTAFQGELYFESIGDFYQGQDQPVVKTDGSQEGTTIIDQGFYVTDIAANNQSLFFNCRQGVYSSSNYELWQYVTSSLSVPPISNFDYTTNGLTVNFDDNSYGDGITFISWGFGDGNTSSSSNPTHTYAEPGTYEACLIVGNNIGLDTLCQQITVDFSPPIANFSTEMNGLIVDFIDNSTNTPSSWSWDFGDGNTSIEQNPQHQYLNEGEYIVCLTASNPTGEDTICQTVNVMSTAVIDFTKNIEVQIFPNPTSEYINITSQQINLPETSIKLYDARGQLARSEYNKSENSIQINTTHLPKGIYYIELSNNKQKLSGQKIIIQ